MTLKMQLTSTSESLLILQLSEEIWNETSKDASIQNPSQKELLQETKTKIEEWKKRLDKLSLQVYDEAYVLVRSVCALQKKIEPDLYKASWEIEWLKKGMELTEHNLDRIITLKGRAEELQREKSLDQKEKIALKNLIQSSSC